VALQAWRGYGQPVIVVRPFNHIGPGSRPTSPCPALAKRIVEARRSGPSLPVGTLTTRRDFTDVRDVVVAYRLLIERGVPGTVYNVCSGRDVAISEVAEPPPGPGRGRPGAGDRPRAGAPGRRAGAAGRRRPPARPPPAGRQRSRSRQRSPTSSPPGRRTDGERCRCSGAAGLRRGPPAGGSESAPHGPARGPWWSAA
jgi:hypothetical protein